MHTAQSFSSAQHNRIHQRCQTGGPRANAPFCGPRHVSFVLALGLTELCSL